MDLVTFTSTPTDPDGTVRVYHWDFGDGTRLNGENLAVVTHAFATSSNKNVRLTVVDNLGRSSTAFTKAVTINNRPPVAHFVNSPAFPAPFETVTFNAATSGDQDGTVTKYEWDVDNDGLFNDDTADGTADQTATRKFNQSGSFTVGARHRQPGRHRDHGADGVRRKPPADCVLRVLARAAHRGAPVTFFSTAADPDSPITSYAWDLDGNGIYADAFGTTVTRTSGGQPQRRAARDGQRGRHELRGPDRERLSARPAPPASNLGGRNTRLDEPVPLVRIAGTLHRRGSRLRR